MKLTWLCWYVSGIFAALLIMTLFVTYAPGAERIAAVMQIVFLGGAIFVYMIIDLTRSTLMAQQKAEEEIKACV